MPVLHVVYCLCIECTMQILNSGVTSMAPTAAAGAAIATDAAFYSAWPYQLPLVQLT